MAVHHFQPTVYYTAIGTYPPVLEIQSDDTVVTTTVDSAGRDGQDQQVTPRGNPQTGPFLIQDAEVGDTVSIPLTAFPPPVRLDEPLRPLRLMYSIHTMWPHKCHLTALQSGKSTLRRGRPS